MPSGLGSGAPRAVLGYQCADVEPLGQRDAPAVGTMSRDGYGGTDTCHVLCTALCRTGTGGMPILLTDDEHRYPPGMLGFHWTRPAASGAAAGAAYGSGPRAGRATGTPAVGASPDANRRHPPRTPVPVGHPRLAQHGRVGRVRRVVSRRPGLPGPGPAWYRRPARPAPAPAAQEDAVSGHRVRAEPTGAADGKESRCPHSPGARREHARDRPQAGPRQEGRTPNQRLRPQVASSRGRRRAGPTNGRARMGVQGVKGMRCGCGGCGP